MEILHSTFDYLNFVLYCWWQFCRYICIGFCE